MSAVQLPKLPVEVVHDKARNLDAAGIAGF
jgi:hypothetical protein